LLSWLETAQRSLVRLTTRHASLEDVFVSLTGRQLAEDAVRGVDQSTEDRLRDS